MHKGDCWANMVLLNSEVRDSFSGEENVKRRIKHPKSPCGKKGLKVLKKEEQDVLANTDPRSLCSHTFGTCSGLHISMPTAHLGPAPWWALILLEPTCPFTCCNPTCTPTLYPGIFAAIALAIHCLWTNYYSTFVSLFTQPMTLGCIQLGR